MVAVLLFAEFTGLLILHRLRLPFHLLLLAALVLLRSGRAGSGLGAFALLFLVAALLVAVLFTVFHLTRFESLNNGILSLSG